MLIEPVVEVLYGIRYVTRVCTGVGDKIPMHRHSHAHATTVKAGRFRDAVTGKEIASFALGRDGETPQRMVIPPEFDHEFEAIELENGVAVLECHWAEPA